MTEENIVLLKKGGKLNETDLANIGAMMMMVSFYSLKLNRGIDCEVPQFKMELK